MDGPRTVMRLSKELWNWTDIYSFGPVSHIRKIYNLFKKST